MMEKMPILIFRPEVPYDESINVVYFLGSQLSVFSRKFSKTASSAHRRKMPEINATSTDTKTLLLDIAEGSRIFLKFIFLCRRHSQMIQVQKQDN